MNSATDEFLNEFAKENGILTMNDVREQAAANDEQEYKKIIELAKVNVLDRTVIEYASRFNDLSDFDFFYNEILPFDEFQRRFFFLLIKRTIPNERKFEITILTIWYSSVPLVLTTCKKFPIKLFVYVFIIEK